MSGGLEAAFAQLMAISRKWNLSHHSSSGQRDHSASATRTTTTIYSSAQVFFSLQGTVTSAITGDPLKDPER